MEQGQIIVAVIGGVSGLLTMLFGWFLNQRGMSGEAAAFESLKRRLDLVNKLAQSKSYAPEISDEIDKFKVEEVRSIMADCRTYSELDRNETAPDQKNLSLWRRVALVYNQISTKGRVYKGLYYAFTLLWLLVIVTSILVSQSNQNNER